MNAEWFIFSNDETFGPYTLDFVKDRYARGRFEPEAFVRKNDGNWTTLEELLGPQDDLSPSEPSSRQVALATPENKQEEISHAPQNDRKGGGEMQPARDSLVPEHRPVPEHESAPQYRSAAQYEPSPPLAADHAPEAPVAEATATKLPSTKRRRSRSAWRDVPLLLTSIVLGAVSAVYLGNWILARIKPQPDAAVVEPTSSVAEPLQLAEPPKPAPNEPIEASQPAKIAPKSVPQAGTDESSNAAPPKAE